MTRLLEEVARSEVAVPDAIEALRRLPFADLGFARVDHHRWLRQRQLELVYAPGKEPEQLRAIVASLLDEGDASVVVTRLPRGGDEPLRALATDRGLDVEWHPANGLLAIPRAIPDARGDLLVLTAGTADLPVAQEVMVTARLLGARTRLVADVGVAGLHRLLAELPALAAADAVVVVAGMEGALASVVGGLAAVPVIACPTSVGYGANLGGLTALLAMLSSCAPGVAAVNVDDGVGAGTIGALIARGREPTDDVGGSDDEDGRVDHAR
ncbi:MAG TPA: nickel pincer cofactor biosynthesis protein LarB [Candidatus Limnocylindrales bacterium]|nr:nickel pincer cofactor biosynthesis protein LarB [Candidatus Limnocylindrales bacterium]